VFVAATTSLKSKFLEIAMISLISEKDPRTDAIALKKKMHSDQSRAMFNETTFKSLLYFSLLYFFLCLCLCLSVFQFITLDANGTFKRFADLQNVRIKVRAAMNS